MRKGKESGGCLGSWPGQLDRQRTCLPREGCEGRGSAPGTFSVRCLGDTGGSGGRGGWGEPWPGHRDVEAMGRKAVAVTSGDETDQGPGVVRGAPLGCAREPL